MAPSLDYTIGCDQPLRPGATDFIVAGLFDTVCATGPAKAIPSCMGRMKFDVNMRDRLKKARRAMRVMP